MKKARTIDKIIAIIFIPIIVLFIFSSAILVPISDRNFYFSKITSYDLVNTINTRFPDLEMSEEDIKDAYNEVLDFLWKGTDFGCGKLWFSESGKEHFADCIPLFELDLKVFLCTGILIFTYVILLMSKLLRPWRPCGFSITFFSFLFVIIFVLVVAGFAIADFNKAFEIFHKVFFPGKTNWLFSSADDPIILLLPEEYFRDCGILIGVLLAIESILCAIYGIICKKRGSKNRQKTQKSHREKCIQKQ